MSRDVRGRQIERGAAHTDIPVVGKLLPPSCELAMSRSMRAVGMLRVVGDVYVVRVLVDRERRQHMVVSPYQRIHDDRSGPGLAAIVGTHEQNIRVAVGIAKKWARGIGPRQIELAVPGGDGRLQGHARCFDVPREAEQARPLQGCVDREPDVSSAALR